MKNTAVSCHDLRLVRGTCYLHLQARFDAPVTLLRGPTGSGKTLILRALAGLEKPSAGTLTLGDQTVYGPGVWVPAFQRPVAYAFQDVRLMPHLTVLENLTLTGVTVAEADAALHQYELAYLSHRYPQHLSGGEAQRVGLVRTLLQPAQLYLFDEPVSALDGETQQRWLYWLRSFQTQRQVPFIYVTHQPIESQIWPEAASFDMQQFRLADQHRPAAPSGC